MEKLRVSSYMIPVKLEQEEDKYILVHGYTGAIDVVSGELLNDIQSVGTKDNLVQPMVEHLLKRGYLTRKTQEEEYDYVKRIARALHKRDTMLLHKVFTFVVTYNCNFRCPYCFENREAKSDTQIITFTKQQVDEAYKAIEEIEPNIELRNKMITLYGGEPLLKANKDIISYIVNVGQQKGYKFSAISNGYDLEHFLDFLSPEQICKIQITIDGTREHHNQRRIHYLHHDTFDKIVANIEKALKQNVLVVVRVNNDNFNVENFVELKNYFDSIGFYKYPNFQLYSAMIRRNELISSKENESIDFISSHSFLSKHKKMGTLNLCKDFTVFQRVYNAICQKSPIAFKSYFCAAQIEGYVLDFLGDIYPCWEVIGNEKYRIGNYKHGSIQWNQEVLKQWHVNISSNPNCLKCKYALFCGGGCIAHSFRGDRSHCAYFRKIFEFAVTKAFFKTSY